MALPSPRTILFTFNELLEDCCVSCLQFGHYGKNCPKSKSRYKYEEGIIDGVPQQVQIRNEVPLSTCKAGGMEKNPALKDGVPNNEKCFACQVKLSLK